MKKYKWFVLNCGVCGKPAAKMRSYRLLSDHPVNITVYHDNSKDCLGGSWPVHGVDCDHVRTP